MNSTLPAGFALTTLACVFTLNEAQAQCTPDSFEPNDSLATATPLFAPPPSGASSGSVQGNLPNLEQDYFSFTLPAGTMLVMNYSDMDSYYSELEGSLLDAAGNVLQIAFSYTSLNQLLISWPNSSGIDEELWFVAQPLASSSAAACHRYLLNWAVTPQPCQFNPTPDDALEPNDSCDLLNNPQLGNGFYANLYASGLAPDWYTVQLQPGERLDVTAYYTTISNDLTADPVNLQLRLGCSSSFPNPLVQSIFPGNRSETITYTNSGMSVETYGLRVSGSEGLGFFDPITFPWPYFAGCNTYDLEIAITDSSNSTAYCFGNGNSLVDCPCGNNSSMNHPGGCAHQDGEGAILNVSGGPSVQMDTLAFGLTSAVRNSVALLVSADNALPQAGSCNGCGILAFDGFRCAGGNLLRHGVRALNAAGESAQGWGFPTTPGGLSGQGAFTAGQTRSFFAFMRTDVNETCGQGQNSSNGVRVTFLP